MNTTISEAYRDLNASLHESKTQKYGVGSFRHAGKVEELRDLTESVTVLDYGCGKGMLGSALGNPDWFFEYDPAIDGKDILPDCVDLVVCTDVLEHIEPEYLESVLTQIADLSTRAVYLTIATGASSNVLDDGRNAHLIIEGANWWREKLEKYFLISSWDTNASEIEVLGSTIRSVAQLVTKSAVSDTIRSEQAFRNCGIVSERIDPQDRHSGVTALACYGPSLKTEWPHIKMIRDKITLVSVSGAHDFLIDKGIVPDIHIECDPREHKAHFTRNPHKDVKYWIASCCHPTLVDQLMNAGVDTALWHVFNSEEDFEIIAPDGPDPGRTLIAGGGSVGCRAFNLMYIRGFRRFKIFGMDCSFEDDGEQHAGGHSGKLHIEWPIRLGDRWFRTSGALVATARGWRENLEGLVKVSRRNGEPDIEGLPQPLAVEMYGDGLLQNMCRS